MSTLYKKKKIKFICLVVLLLLVSSFCFGQTLSTEEQWCYLGPSFSLPLVESVLPYVSLAFPETQESMPYISNSIQIFSITPLYWFNVSDALIYTGIELALPATGLGLMFSGIDNDVVPYLSNFILMDYNRLTKFNVYEVYKETRSRSSNLEYSQSFDSYSFWDITKAPFDPEILSDPIVWIPSILLSASFLTTQALTIPEYTPVWTTGKTYIGSTELHPAVWGGLVSAVSVSTMSINATGEEAYYRGVIYEEIKNSYSPLVAKCFDMIFFPLIHVIGDVQAGNSTPTILINFGLRALATLAFDLAYDKGGLLYSSAIHFWSNQILDFGGYLLTSGAPSE